VPVDRPKFDVRNVDDRDLVRITEIRRIVILEKRHSGSKVFIVAVVRDVDLDGVGPPGILLLAANVRSHPDRKIGEIFQI
jgi:hypothetical protein